MRDDVAASSDRLAETPMEKLDAVREWVRDGIAKTLESEGGEFMLGIESASVLEALDDIEEALRGEPDAKTIESIQAEFDHGD